MRNGRQMLRDRLDWDLGELLNTAERHATWTVESGMVPAMWHPVIVATLDAQLDGLRRVSLWPPPIACCWQSNMAR